MPDLYSPRQMPKRFLEGAPDVVRENVLDLFAIPPAAPLAYDVILRPERGSFRDMWMDGIDIGKCGSRGCSFQLQAYEMGRYRDRNRRKRVAWRDLTPAAQSAILAYLAE